MTENIDPGAQEPISGEPDGFWQDTGPEFSPESSPDAPELEAVGEDGQELGWTPESVTEFLRGIQAPAFNSMLNPLLGVQEVDWTHREKRLAQVAPAIAREWNKIPEVKALAGHTDRGLILAYLLLEYLGPRAFQVVQERRERAEQAEQEAAAPDVAATSSGIIPESTFHEPGPPLDGLPKRGL